MSRPSNGEFNLWFPAGIGLLGIGLLTLATPFLTVLQPHELIIDLTAGFTLSLVGGWAILKSRARD